MQESKGWLLHYDNNIIFEVIIFEVIIQPDIND